VVASGGLVPDLSGGGGVVHDHLAGRVQRAAVKEVGAEAARLNDDDTDAERRNLGTEEAASGVVDEDVDAPNRPAAACATAAGWAGSVTSSGTARRRSP